MTEQNQNVAVQYKLLYCLIGSTFVANPKDGANGIMVKLGCSIDPENRRKSIEHENNKYNKNYGIDVNDKVDMCYIATISYVRMDGKSKETIYRNIFREFFDLEKFPHTNEQFFISSEQFREIQESHFEDEIDVQNENITYEGCRIILNKMIEKATVKFTEEINKEPQIVNRKRGRPPFDDFYEMINRCENFIEEENRLPRQKPNQFVVNEYECKLSNWYYNKLLKYKNGGLPENEMIAFKQHMDVREKYK